MLVGATQAPVPTREINLSLIWLSLLLFSWPLVFWCQCCRREMHAHESSHLALESSDRGFILEASQSGWTVLGATVMAHCIPTRDTKTLSPHSHLSNSSMSFRAQQFSSVELLFPVGLFHWVKAGVGREARLQEDKQMLSDKNGSVVKCR